MNGYVAACGVIAAMAGVARGQSEFAIVDLGRLPAAHTAVSTAIAADNSVVGWCQGPLTTLRGFLAPGGQPMVELPMPPNSGYNLPTDISASGEYIVGVAQVDFSTAPRPYRFSNGVYEMLPVPPGYAGARPEGVNSSGAVVGTFVDASFSSIDDFYWSPQTGYVDPTPGTNAFASDINDLGDVVGGGPPILAYRWRLDGGLVILGAVPGWDDYARAEGISQNGAHITGGSYTVVPGRDRAIAFVSGPSGPPAPIGSGQTHVSVGFAINSGGVAVGMSGTSSTPRRDSWVFRPGQGMELLDPIVDHSVLLQMGSVADINDAGAIAGNGYFAGDPNPRAILILPAGSACLANCDASTEAPQLTVLDFNCFLNRFNAGDPAANCDASTAEPVLNVLDFNCFLNAFAAGCR